MLPKTIARQLKYGHNIHPEQFESVTLCFIEITNYHEVANKLQPVNTVTYLNSVFSFIDSKLEMFDVYKVGHFIILHFIMLHFIILHFFHLKGNESFRYFRWIVWAISMSKVECKSQLLLWMYFAVITLIYILLLTSRMLRKCIYNNRTPSNKVYLSLIIIFVNN